MFAGTAASGPRGTVSGGIRRGNGSRVSGGATMAASAHSMQALIGSLTRLRSATSAPELKDAPPAGLFGGRPRRNVASFVDEHEDERDQEIATKREARLTALRSAASKAAGLPSSVADGGEDAKDDGADSGEARLSYLLAGVTAGVKGDMRDLLTATAAPEGDSGSDTKSRPTDARGLRGSSTGETAVDTPRTALSDGARGVEDLDKKLPGNVSLRLLQAVESGNDTTGATVDARARPPLKLSAASRRFRNAAHVAATMFSIKEDQHFRTSVFGDQGGVKESEEDVRPPPLVVMPDSKTALVFDLVFAVSLLWMSMRGPYRAAFVEEPHAAVEVLEALATFALLGDIIAQFRTAFIDDGLINAGSWPMAKRYLKSWFVADLVASFPYRYVLETESVLGSLLSYVVVFRAVRWSRIRKVESVVIERSSMFGEGVRSLLRQGKLGLYVMMVAHVAACSWFLIARLEQHSSDSWTTRYEVDDLDNESQYLSSLYWAWSTLTTVGYGDVSAHTDMERLFSLFMIALGAVLYALIVGKMSALSHDLGFLDAEFRRKNVELAAWVKYFAPRRQLQTQLQQYYQRLYDEHPLHKLSLFSADMSPHLQRDVLLAVHHNTLKTVPVFKYTSLGFKIAVAKMLQPVLVVKGDYVVVEGEIADYLYFVRAGVVQMVNNLGFVTTTLTGGSFFGESMALDGEPAPYSVRAKTECSLLVLVQDDLASLLVDYPEFEDALRRLVGLRGAANATTGERERVPPPASCNHWGDVRARPDFHQYYGALLKRSRMLQATIYRPSPKDLSCVRLPRDVLLLAGHLAQNQHEVWAAQRISQGWRYGSKRDNAAKYHPDLVPWDYLSEEAMSYDLASVISTLKYVIANNYTICVRRPPPVAADIDGMDDEPFLAAGLEWQFGAAALEGETYEPRPFPTEDIELSPELEQLVDRISEDAHEVWAKKRMDAGWTWGHHRDDEKKQHNCLLPFQFLTEEEKEMDRAGTESTVCMLIAMGYEATKNASGDRDRQAGKAFARAIAHKRRGAAGGASASADAADVAELKDNLAKMDSRMERMEKMLVRLYRGGGGGAGLGDESPMARSSNRMGRSSATLRKTVSDQSGEDYRPTPMLSDATLSMAERLTQS